MKKRIILVWFAVGLWMGIIYYLSNQPNLSTGLGVWDLVGRKTAHMVEFAVLVFLVYNALINSFSEAVAKKSLKPFLFIAAIFSFLYAAGDEYHQTFIFGRVGTPNDVAVDSAGIIIMFFLIYYNKINPYPRRFLG